MFKNYFLVAWRNLYRHPVFALINIVGLALGLGAAMLVLQYVGYESSYDRQYNNADKTYRIAAGTNWFGRDSYSLYMPTTLAEIKDKVPQVKYAATYTQPTTYEVAIGDREFEEQLSFVNGDFFKVFDVLFIQGDRENAVDIPFSVVLTESIARKYFNATDVVGRSLKLEGEKDFTVSAVIADFDKNTHIANGLFASHNSAARRGFATDTSVEPYQYRLSVYLQTSGGSVDSLAGSVNELYSTEWQLRAQAWQRRGNNNNSQPDTLTLQPLTGIHFADAQHEVRQVEGKEASVVKITYGMTAVVALGLAVMILGISCCNYIYLSIARASQRGKEIAMRKVTGASREQLFGQFICESLVLTLIAAVLALLLAWVLRPLVTGFVGVDESAFSFASGQFALMFAGLVVVTALLAGLYPAVVLSRISPLHALFGGRNVLGKVRLRRILVIAQFTVAALLLMITFFIFEQLSWLGKIDMGFETENIVVVSPQSRIRGRDNFSSRAQSLREELLQYPEIRQISVSDGGPLRFFGVANMEAKLPGQSDEEFVEFNSLGVDDNFASLYRPRLLEGRFLAAEQYPTDLTRRERWTVISGGGAVLTMAALDSLGIADPKQIVGKELDIKITGFRGWGASDDVKKFKVVGVIDNINFGTGSAAIYPQMLITPFTFPGYFAVKTSGDNNTQAMQHIETAFAKVFPSMSIRNNFLADLYQRENAALLKLGYGFTVATLISVFISCLGLYAIAAFTVERRTKEVGVRKVIGASVAGIVRILIWDFTKPVLIAIAVALPLAILSIFRMLEYMPNHAPLGAGIYIEVMLVIVAIAWLTVSSHTLRTAVGNPASALRYE